MIKSYIVFYKISRRVFFTPAFVLYATVIYLTDGWLASAVASPAAVWEHGTHSHGHRDSKGLDNRNYARTSAANLNRGEPRTVRMIYLLPNDRPYRADVVQLMKDEIRTVQTFFADQMEAHGYGRRTFRVETDSQGEPMVHRVNGQYPESHYYDSDIERTGEDTVAFDLSKNIYLSTGSAVTALTAPDGAGYRDWEIPPTEELNEAGYRLIVVDIEKGRAATIGDTLDISAQSTNPFIGVEPVRYTVTVEDVRRSLIQLPELVAYEIPKETELLANYPNPFNPETWIPYRLAADAFVTLTIYDSKGHVVRTLEVGHRIAAVYESRSKAIYWDGRNEFGETVASGVYFYQLRAGDYSATRKMVILK